MIGSRIQMPEILMMCSVYMYSQSKVFAFSLLSLSLLWAIFRYGSDANEKKEREKSDKKRDEQMAEQLNSLYQSTFISSGPGVAAGLKINDDDFH